MRKSCTTTVAIAAVLCLLAGIYCGYQSTWFQKTFLYPFAYEKEIRHCAAAQNLDPYLVAAMVLAESKFCPQARSPQGATGLMQIMPQTACWIGQQMEMPVNPGQDLLQPELNLRMGTWYLSSLQKEFEGNQVLALAAYNGGRGNVREWMETYRWNSEFSDINQIPYKETREYVASVLKNRDRYRDLYEQRGQAHR